MFFVGDDVTMVLKVIIFIDGANIFSTSRQFRSNFRVDFFKLAQTLVGSRQLIRTYYFGSEGILPNQKQLKFYEKLQRSGISVILRPLRRRGDNLIEKGIDVALATEMLSLGFRNAYDIAILVSGDSDYIHTVNKLKNIGKIVEIAAFKCGFARELQLSADRVIILDELADQIEYRN